VCSTELSQVTVNVCPMPNPYLAAMSRPHQLNRPQPQRLHLHLRLLNPVMRCPHYRPLHRRQLGGLSPALTWHHVRSTQNWVFWTNEKKMKNGYVLQKPTSGTWS
jgi:hypothetical protein